jgi:hypothetical protein
MEKKVCSKCKEEKEVCEFGKRKDSKDGLSRECKSCINGYFKKYSQSSNTKEYKKKYRETNKEKKKESDKKYREENKEKINQKLREWRKSNKEKLKKYYNKSKETNKKYLENNRDKVRERRNKYFRLRKNNDPLFKLSCNLRTLICLSLTNNGYSKNTKSYEILGISFNELLLYFEGLFENWMSWDNYGRHNGEYNYGWDIDHKIPLSSAKNEEEIIKLNHYTNLQPLCSKINREIKKDNY